MMKNYKNLAENKEGKGAILLAVNKGKMSEGIDFTDSLARAVFLVGVPFPPAKALNILIKKDYLKWMCEEFKRTPQYFKNTLKPLDPSVWYL
jgi:Rad3-related DNA helicase